MNKNENGIVAILIEHDVKVHAFQKGTKLSRAVCDRLQKDPEAHFRPETAQVVLDWVQKNLRHTYTMNDLFYSGNLTNRGPLPKLEQDQRHTRKSTTVTCKACFTETRKGTTICVNCEAPLPQ
jgi:hypothetical protein